MAAVGFEREEKSYKKEKEEEMIGVLIYHTWLLFQLNLVLRNKTVTIKEILHVFAVGATFAVVADIFVLGYAVKMVGLDFVSYTYNPVFNETMKIVFVAFLLFFTRLGKTTGVSDAILLAAAAGGGYGFTEDVVRAVGLGLSEMNQHFPAYDIGNIWQLLSVWLPSERTVGVGPYEYIGKYVAGHLMWTALVGFGVGVARKFAKKNFLVYLLPVSLLIWVIIDHSLANNSSSAISFLYPLYGKGVGIYYALNIAIVMAVIMDELLVNKYLPKDEKLLLPGEKRRSIFGELRQMVVNFAFGFKHWFALSNYFQIRRQLAFASAEGEVGEEMKELLRIRRDYAVTSVRFGVNREYIPSALKEIWKGPPLKFGRLSANQKILSFVALGMVLTQFYNIWLFLFSTYLPYELSRTIANSQITVVVGFVGYVVVIYQLVAYYRNKQWQKVDQDNRVVRYSNALLTHTSGANVLWNLPFFFGGHPLITGSSFYFWDQFMRFLKFYNDVIRPWVGGTLSAGINFIPIVGNIKSGFEALSGHDYLSGNDVKGWDRFWAAVGAVPLAGNVLRAMKYLPRAGRVIGGVRYRALLHSGLRPAIMADNIMGKVGFVQGVKGDFDHAINEARKGLESMDQGVVERMARSRQQALDQWTQDGWVRQVEPGHYQRGTTLQAVNIYTGKALHNFPESFRDAVGQVTVDEGSKTVMYDGISTTYTAVKSDHLVKALEDLQKQYPGSTIIYNQMFKAGASALHVAPPSGKTFEVLNFSPNAVGSR